MKKILMLVYAACAMLVIIGSLLWFAFTLRSDSLLGKAEALKNFKVFTQRTAEVFADQGQESDSARLQLKLEQLCRNYQKYIRTVLIRDSAGVLFSWPQHADIFSYNEQQVVEVKNLPLFFAAAQMHIPLPDQNTSVTIHAALQTIPVETVFSRGQVVFLLLLVIVLLTIAALIFSYVDFKDKDKNPSKQTAPESFSSPAGSGQEPSRAESTEKAASARAERKSSTHGNAAAWHKDSPAHYGKEETAVITEAPIEVNNSVPLSTQLESLNRLHIYEDNPAADSQKMRTEPVDAAEDSNLHGMDSEESAEIVQLAPSNDEDAVSAVQSTAEKSAEDTDPNHDIHAENYGSFENYSQPSPPSKKMQESSTSAAAPLEPGIDLNANPAEEHSLEQATIIEELTTALTETAVAEEDLTLLLIHARDIAHNQQVMHLLRSTLDRIHRVFIFNQDILGLIVFYAPLDQGMQIANHLYDEVYALLNASDKKSLGIGLTTRAGRLIPAHRMIEEASAAISKAIEEGGDPIVAFRVNPDKYRRCLARLS